MKTPTNITLNKEKNLLTVTFDDINYPLSTEYLRVYSPSAEVRGHGPGQQVLQIAKEAVTVKEIRSVGNYAVVLVFSDGHDTGIYSWEYLYALASSHDKLWREYLANLKAAGHHHSLHK